MEVYFFVVLPTSYYCARTVTGAELRLKHVTRHHHSRRGRATTSHLAVKVCGLLSCGTGLLQSCLLSGMGTARDGVIVLRGRYET